jgi:signal transduction histidine kinase
VLPRWRLPAQASTGRPPDRSERRQLAGWLVIELDLEYIRSEVLPDLLQRRFARGGHLQYDVRIVARGQPGRVIYSSTPSPPPEAFDNADARATFLQLRLGPLGDQAGPSSPVYGGRRLGPPSRNASDARGGWLLLVVHRAGSLDELVSQTRRRNVAVSFGVLVVLAVSLAVLLASTRRAQRLARLQMDFVAGVSHELRTPLSVIQSAGENLADGLVAGGDQVRRYGAVVRDEGRRLSQMVERILGFAGMQSGRMNLEFRPTDPRDLIAGALAASEPLIRASGCTVETAVAPDVPKVAADATALTHCLRNLLDNAVTHGAAGGWVRISAQTGADSRQRVVEIRVEDRGPGIDPREAPRLFDPFYRGHRSIRDQVRGFGLGLTLARRIVEAHSGTVKLESAPGGGACVFVRLPALPGADLEDPGRTPPGADHGETNSARRG